MHDKTFVGDFGAGKNAGYQLMDDMTSVGDFALGKNEGYLDKKVETSAGDLGLTVVTLADMSDKTSVGVFVAGTERGLPVGGRYDLGGRLRLGQERGLPG